ncbi:hypothetical protein COHA_000516 [Chlorella ohadii]|uniref:Exostosin GT47 domain-containing protein n=1 Tax=Chlorella ohadii TaxID=2649997 RepID=A0AAD5E0V4_9CHLO|nr:hypothetical protein COHA_000516 [Chlorella ohadii]
MPRGPVGPRLQPWVQNRSCLVYILDGSAELAPYADVESCNMSDPKVLPPGKGVKAVNETARYNSLHGGPWWLTQALRNATGLLTSNLSEACMVWLDMDCYNAAYMGLEGGAQERQRGLIRQMLDVLMGMPRFKLHQGRDFAVALTHLALRTTTWAPQFCSESGLRRAYHVVSDLGLSSADIDLSKPVVGSHRPKFMYMQAACPKQGATQTAVGPRMRAAVAAQLDGLAPDLRLSCAGQSRSVSHSNMTRHLRQSVFCIVTPGETPSSAQLTESILAGCIPVFVGPPWHVMPLHRDVDWAGMGVFINITSDTPWLVANETAGGWQSQRSIEQQLRAGRQTAGVAGVQVNLPDLRAAYNFLRAMPQPEVERRQAALDRERYKFLYYPGPGGYSHLADIVLGNMLQYGAGLQS